MRSACAIGSLLQSHDRLFSTAMFVLVTAILRKRRRLVRPATLRLQEGIVSFSVSSGHPPPIVDAILKRFRRISFVVLRLFIFRGLVGLA